MDTETGMVTIKLPKELCQILYEFTATADDSDLHYLARPISLVLNYARRKEFLQFEPSEVARLLAIVRNSQTSEGEMGSGNSSWSSSWFRLNDLFVEELDKILDEKA